MSWSVRNCYKAKRQSSVRTRKQISNQSFRRREESEDSETWPVLHRVYSLLCNFIFKLILEIAVMYHVGLAKEVRQVLNLRIEVKKKSKECMQTAVPFTLQNFFFFFFFAVYTGNNQLRSNGTFARNHSKARQAHMTKMVRNEDAFTQRFRTAKGVRTPFFFSVLGP